jgi:hypothetical protein
MTQVDIEEYEFFKRIKKLIPIIMLLCSILGGIITTTWVSKDIYDKLATKDDIKTVFKESIDPLNKKVDINSKRIDSLILTSTVSIPIKHKKRTKIFGYIEQKINGMIVTIPVYR